MRYLGTKTVFSVSALANLCLAIIPMIVIFLGEATPTVVALNVGLIVLAIIALAATVFLFVRNDRQKKFFMAIAASSATPR
jgi:hypothetical protein